MRDDILIRQASMDEIDRVMLFLKENWGEKHVMANSKELMSYEHAWNGEFTYMIAEDCTTKKIYGVYGYLPYSNERSCDMGGGIWKVIQSPRFMLGIELFKYVQDHTRCRMFADCGANLKTRGHRELVGHVNAQLDQYYRLNLKKEIFSIAVINVKKIPEKQTDLSCKLIRLETADKFKKLFDVSQYKDVLPYKDNDYIEHRYYRHIKYQYTVLGIDHNGKTEAVIIGRDFTANGKKVFRIIDFLGDEDFFAGTFDAWEMFLSEGDYEYVDFYEYGLAPENLMRAGFFRREEDDINIIPNYFEPFEQRNIEIYISTNIHGKFRMFKGDGDQDRPNCL